MYEPESKEILYEVILLITACQQKKGIITMKSRRVPYRPKPTKSLLSKSLIWAWQTYQTSDTCDSRKSSEIYEDLWWSYLSVSWSIVKSDRMLNAVFLSLTRKMERRLAAFNIKVSKYQYACRDICEEKSHV